MNMFALFLTLVLAGITCTTGKYFMFRRFLPQSMLLIGEGGELFNLCLSSLRWVVEDSMPLHGFILADTRRLMPHSHQVYEHLSA